LILRQKKFLKGGGKKRGRRERTGAAKRLAIAESGKLSQVKSDGQQEES